MDPLVTHARKVRSWAILGVLAACFGLITAGTAGAEDRKTKIITFSSSAAYSSAGNNYSSGFLVDKYHEGVLLVTTSGVSGTPTLNVFLETSDDNSTYYYHSVPASIAIAGTTAYAVTNLGKYVRVKGALSAVTEFAITYEIKGVMKN